MTTTGQPVLDVMAVLAAHQQQLDDLTEVVAAQQRMLDGLLGGTDTAPDNDGASHPGGR
jgi:hypothetical protein